MTADPHYIPRVAAVHDMCGYGKCSLTAAIPILSAAGCDVCPVPTALFSAHTKYAVFTFHDTTDILSGYLDAWRKENVELDACTAASSAPPTRCPSSSACTANIRPRCGWSTRLWRRRADVPDVHAGTVRGDGGSGGRRGRADAEPDRSEHLDQARLPRQDLDDAAVTELLDALLGLGAKNVVLKGIDHGDGKIINYVASAEKGAARRSSLCTTSCRT